MRLSAALFTVLAGVVAFSATNAPWLNKDFRAWSDKDAQQILTDSPWAKPLRMPVSQRPNVMVVEPGSSGAPLATASLGNPSNTSSNQNGSTSVSNPASAMPSDAHGGPATSPAPSGAWPGPPAPQPPEVVTIVWASAAPVRLAVMKLRAGVDALNDDQIKRAFRERDNYTIAAIGLPAPPPGADAQQLASDATLTVKGKAPVAATGSDYRRIGNSDVYFFRFPKNTPLTVSDGQVEFRLKFQDMQFKKTFDLSRMQYQGKLAL